jgi:hypothetical protein
MTRTRYEFRVHGSLSPEAREALCDMCIHEYPEGALLHGDVLDEAHLLGILAQFHALDLVVVSAQRAVPGPHWTGAV